MIIITTSPCQLRSLECLGLHVRPRLKISQKDGFGSAMVILLSEAPLHQPVGRGVMENVAAGSRRGSGAKPTDMHPQAP